MNTDRILLEVGRLYLQNLELQDIVRSQEATLDELRALNEAQSEDPQPTEE